jgi:hypothetical protein
MYRAKTENRNWRLTDRAWFLIAMTSCAVPVWAGSVWVGWFG